MRSKEAILADINMQVPSGIDWHAGAKRYLDAVFTNNDRGAIERYALTKPYYALSSENFERGLEEAVHYQFNFTNAIRLLNLPGGSRIMDVACGAGWFAHQLSRMGYEAFGFDISLDFIEMAKQRLGEDRHLSLDRSSLDRRFFVLNVERDPPPRELCGTFAAVILESCLHHFIDPITAMTHIGGLLNENGLAVIIEGENCNGEIKPEYMAVMREYDTLERPYPRALLVEALTAAGLPHVEFVAPINGWFSANDPLVPHLSAHHRNILNSMNVCICARNAAALHRVFPFLRQQSAEAVEAEAAGSSDASLMPDRSPLQAPSGFIQRILLRFTGNSRG